MKKFAYGIVLILSIFCANMAIAVRVDSIYVADVPAASQSASERNNLLKQALQQVLVKITGNAQILDNAKIKISTEELNSLVQEYGYSLSSNNMNQKSYLLRVRFDPEGINQLLQKLAVPAWGVERPLLLIWAERSGPHESAEIIASDSSDNIHASLTEYAKERGIPVIFPIMDLTDLGEVSENDVNTMAIPTLQNAAKRYGSNGLLVVKVAQLGTNYTVQAKLVSGNSGEQSFTLQAATLDGVLKALVNQVADTLTGRFATATNTVKTQVTLRVTGVARHSDLVKLTHYLQRLTPVAEVQPMQVAGEEVLFSISLRGSLESFVQAISAGYELTEMPNQEGEKILFYQWHP